MNTYDKIKKVGTELNNQFFEREDIIHSMLVSMVARSHMVILGPAGTAKSDLVNALNAKIDGARKFTYLFTKFTQPEEVFGPFNIPGLAQGKFERILDGKLADAHFAFLDEIFKANSAILNSLLTVLNERKFDNGVHRISVPLVSLFGASNETPQDENLSALYDRFMIRHTVRYIASEAKFDTYLDNMFTKNKNAGNAVITLSDIETAQKEAATVTADKSVRDSMQEIRRQCKSQGYEMSDRRWGQSASVLQAMAYLEGRDHVMCDDLMVYSDIFWDKPEDRRKVAKIVGQIANPDMFKIEEIEDAVDEILNEYSKQGGGAAAGIEAARKLAKHKEALDKIKVGPKGQEMKERITAKYKEAIGKAIRLPGFADK